MNTSQREHTPRSQETRKPRHAQNVLSTDMWERIQERAARELSRPRQMFLPGLEPTMRAMPNHIARSSLFAPLSKTHQRRFLNDHILISRRDVVIRFTGSRSCQALPSWPTRFSKWSFAATELTRAWPRRLAKERWLTIAATCRRNRRIPASCSLTKASHAEAPTSIQISNPSRARRTPLHLVRSDKTTAATSSRSCSTHRVKH